MQGRFIVFEGIDGSGLSTQASMLKDYYISKGRQVLLTKEQTDSIIGGLIKSSLRSEWEVSPLALQMLFAADRAHHLSTQILPALEEEKIVICDRYVLSTLAFGSLDIDVNFLKSLNGMYIHPDVTIYIDTPVDVCLKRIEQSRQHAELFEDEKRMRLVKNNYMSLKSYFPRTFIIDGNGTKEEVFSRIINMIETKIQ